MKAVSIDQLEPGMILARTVTNSDMIVVLSEGTELSNAHITRLKFLEIPVVHIKDEFDLSKNFQQASAVLKKDSAFSHDFEKISKLANEIFKAIEEGEVANCRAYFADGGQCRLNRLPFQTRSFEYDGRSPFAARRNFCRNNCKMDAL